MRRQNSFVIWLLLEPPSGLGQETFSLFKRRLKTLLMLSSHAMLSCSMLRLQRETLMGAFLSAVGASVTFILYSTWCIISPIYSHNSALTRICKILPEFLSPWQVGQTSGASDASPERQNLTSSVRDSGRTQMNWPMPFHARSEGICLFLFDCAERIETLFDVYLYIYMCVYRYVHKSYLHK